MNTLRFKSAGSKYDAYRTASTHPSYAALSEEEFRHRFCRSLVRTLKNNRGECLTYGLGTLLGEFDLRVTSSPSRYAIWEFTPRPPLDSSDILWQRVTATDGKTWAFYTGCYSGSDQKQWVVASNTQHLSLDARRDIIDHAISLGFKRENFVFLDYDKCDSFEGGSHDNKIRLPDVMVTPKKPLVRKVPLKEEPQPPQLEQRRTSFVKVQPPSPPPLRRYAPLIPAHSHEEIHAGKGWSAGASLF